MESEEDNKENIKENNNGQEKMGENSANFNGAQFSQLLLNNLSPPQNNPTQLLSGGGLNNQQNTSFDNMSTLIYLTNLYMDNKGWKLLNEHGYLVNIFTSLGIFEYLTNNILGNNIQLKKIFITVDNIDKIFMGDEFYLSLMNIIPLVLSKRQDELNSISFQINYFGLINQGNNNFVNNNFNNSNNNSNFNYNSNTLNIPNLNNISNNNNNYNDNSNIINNINLNNNNNYNLINSSGNNNNNLIGFNNTNFNNENNMSNSNN